ncbi:unnamed protein product [Triticum aestivum]|uniref:CASP-like protein n=2 Tax=Triticum aestivum TaxID=4565 RepID=A0A9R1JER2_WHEAT|nr:uncharacterized protein LOC123048777 [Triticum aestivum]KAF7014212.1 hypothetical protein CFC21_028228 [Triticum aestivum]SPT16458.1 unnamed protein product [Triticum aestivum]
MAALKPSPPPVPAGIVVAVLALVRVVLTLTLSLGRVLVADEALPYLGFATLWVISAAAATKVVGSRAWAEGSAPAVFLQALTGGVLKASFLVLQALGAVMLCGQFLLYVVASASGSGSEFQKRAHGAFNKELIRGDPPRTAVLGTFASTLLILLILAGSLVECMMSKKIGSVIVDVGIFGSSAIACFVVIPAVVLTNWREDQMSKKNMTHVANY